MKIKISDSYCTVMRAMTDLFEESCNSMTYFMRTLDSERKAKYEKRGEYWAYCER